MQIKPLLKKGLVVGIIVLLGMNLAPLVSSSSSGNDITRDILNPKLLSDSRGFHIHLSGKMGRNGWFVSPVDISIIADNGSEAMHFYYKFHNSDPWTEYMGGQLEIYQDGIYNFSALIIDQYGNQWYLGPVQIKIDQTPPVMNKFIAKRIGFFEWKFTANVSDGGSGIAWVEFYVEHNLIGNCSTFPYVAYWKGFFFHLRWEYRRSYDPEVFPVCIFYDNAGNSNIWMMMPG